MVISTPPVVLIFAILSSTVWTPVASAGSFQGVVDLGSLDGSNGFRLDGTGKRIQGTKRTGVSGSSLAAGDVNGDGFADVIVGAPGERANTENGAGSTYVVFGRASGFPESLDLSIGIGALDGSNGFQIKGVGKNDHSGSSVARVGDVNGDGYADLIVGAPGADVRDARKLRAQATSCSVLRPLHRNWICSRLTAQMDFAWTDSISSTKAASPSQVPET